MKYFFLLVSIILCANQAYSNAVTPDNGVISFGGNEIKQDFYTRAQLLLSNISKFFPAQGIYPNQELKLKLAAALGSVRLEILDRDLLLRGEKVFAINYPLENPPRIEISQSKYNDLLSSRSYTMLNSLILHELLPIAGQIDLDYSKSNWIITYQDIAINYVIFDYPTFDVFFRAAKSNLNYSIYVDPNHITFSDFLDYERFLQFALARIDSSQWKTNSEFWKTLIANYFTQIQDSAYCENIEINSIPSFLKNSKAPLELNKFVSSQFSNWKKQCSSVKVAKSF